MEKLLEAVLECDSICLGVFDNVGYDLKKIADNLVADRVKTYIEQHCGRDFL